MGANTWVQPGISYNAIPVVLYGPNLIANSPNGSWAKTNFEDGTIAGWQPAQNCSLANSTAQAYDGTHSLAVTATAAADMYPTAWASGTSGPLVMPGAPYTMQAYVRAATVGRNTTCQLQFLNFSGTNVFTTPANYIPDVTTGWTLIYTNGIAPATAFYVQPLVYFQAPALSEVHYIDAVSVNQGMFYPV